MPNKLVPGGFGDGVAVGADLVEQLPGGGEEQDRLDECLAARAATVGQCWCLSNTMKRRRERGEGVQ